MYEDISEAKKTQALATSSGVPPLLRGIAFFLILDFIIVENKFIR
jgi:hypothetical protein